MRPRLALLALVLPCVFAPDAARAAPMWGLAPASSLIVTSVTNASSLGDTVTYLGTGFAGTSVAVVTPALSPPLLPLTALTRASAMGTVTVPPLSTGTYDLSFANIDGATRYVVGGLSVTNVPTLSSIYGANLIGDYPAALATCSGGCVEGSTVTGLTDVSGYGQNAVCTGAVIYHVNESRWLMPNQPSIEISADTANCEVASFSLQGGSAIYALGAWNVSATTPTGLANYQGNNPAWENFGGASGVFDVLMSRVVGSAVNTKPGAINTNFIGIGGGSYSGGTITLTNSVNNGPIVSTPITTTTFGSPEILYPLGYVSPNSAPFYTPRVAFVNVTPTTTQSLQTAQLFNLTYGITTPPSLSYATPALAACTGGVSCYMRLQGTNFEPGMTATVSGGIGALTVGTIAASGKYADVQIPSAAAGTYNLTLANPDGRAQTFPNAITVTTALNPEQTVGPYLVGWWQGSWACPSPGCSVGSNVSSNNDLGGLGNNLTQATTLDQPQVNSMADPLYNGAPTLVSLGSPVILTDSVIMDAIAGGVYEFSTWKNASTPAGTAYALSYSSGSQLQTEGAGSANTKPKGIFDSSTISWGTAVGTTLPSYLVTRGVGTGTFTYGVDVNDDGALEVTTTGSGTTSYVAGNFSQFANFGGATYAPGTTGFAVFVAEDLSSNAAALKAMCQIAQTQVTSAVCP